MAKTKQTRKTVKKTDEADGAYLLKLVLYIVLGTQWIWLERANGTQLPIPVGLIIGIVFAMHDHFKIDRKIEYAVLLVATLVGFIANIGIVVGA